MPNDPTITPGDAQKPRRLNAAALYHRCDVAQFRFETTVELPDLADHIGQQRARDAVTFGLDIERQGYNLFVMGPAGAGKHALVRRCLEGESQRPVPRRAAACPGAATGRARPAARAPAACAAARNC